MPTHTYAAHIRQWHTHTHTQSYSYIHSYQYRYPHACHYLAGSGALPRSFERTLCGHVFIIIILMKRYVRCIIIMDFFSVGLPANDGHFGPLPLPLLPSTAARKSIKWQSLKRALHRKRRRLCGPQLFFNFYWRRFYCWKICVPAVKGFSFRPLKCQAYKKSTPPSPDGSKYTYIEWHTTGKQVSFRCMHVHGKYTMYTCIYVMWTYFVRRIWRTIKIKISYAWHRWNGKMFDMADTQITTTTHPTKDDGYSAISLLPASSLWFCVAMCLCGVHFKYFGIPFKFLIIFKNWWVADRASRTMVNSVVLFPVRYASFWFDLLWWVEVLGESFEWHKIYFVILEKALAGPLVE